MQGLLPKYKAMTKSHCKGDNPWAPMAPRHYGLHATDSSSLHTLSITHHTQVTCHEARKLRCEAPGAFQKCRPFDGKCLSKTQYALCIYRLLGPQGPDMQASRPREPLDGSSLTSHKHTDGQLLH